MYGLLKPEAVIDIKDITGDIKKKEPNALKWLAPSSSNHIKEDIGAQYSSLACCFLLNYPTYSSMKNEMLNDDGQVICFTGKMKLAVSFQT